MAHTAQEEGIERDETLQQRDQTCRKEESPCVLEEGNQDGQRGRERGDCHHDSEKETVI